MNLSAIDLNLLVSLEALLRTGSVTRAAADVGLSQPAMSHNLRRLREVLGDPVLVRVGRGMVTTPHGDALREPVDAALRAARQVLEGPPAFDPARDAVQWRIGAQDGHAVGLCAPLLARLAAEAPRARLRLVDRGIAMIDDVMAGRLDLVIGAQEGLAVPMADDVRRRLEPLVARSLYEDEFVAVTRADHPIETLDLATYVGLDHVLVAPGGGDRGVVDRVLADRGRSRRVVLTTPTFLLAVQVVARTDTVATLPRRVAEAAGEGLRTWPLPIEVPGFRIAMAWHPRLTTDPAHRWLRARLREVAA